MAYQKDMVAINNGIEQVGLVDKGNCGVATSLPAESTDGLDTALRGSAFTNGSNEISHIASSSASMPQKKMTLTPLNFNSIHEENCDPSLNNNMSDALPSLGSKEFEALSKSMDTRPLGYRILKRLFDILISLLAFFIVIALWPLTLAFLCVIAVQTKGFPIYVQERVGQYGRSIRVPKLRTMIVDSDNVSKYLNEKQLSQWHKERKVDADPRIVPIGRILRACSIDELSNFIPAFFGSMSVVGPRPIVEDETAWYGKNLPKVLSVPQGITGYWQCTSRNKASFESGNRQKLELEYASTASLLLDSKIIVKTFGVMFGKKKTGK